MRVTTVVASIQSASTTDALLVLKTNISILLPRNARLTHAQSKVFVAETAAPTYRAQLRAQVQRELF